MFENASLGFSKSEISANVWVLRSNFKSMAIYFYPNSFHLQRKVKSITILLKKKNWLLFTRNLKLNVKAVFPFTVHCFTEIASCIAWARRIDGQQSVLIKCVISKIRTHFLPCYARRWYTRGIAAKHNLFPFDYCLKKWFYKDFWRLVRYQNCEKKKATTNKQLTS